ncbi:MAG: hypothetical protein QHH74_12100 [Spirochaetota bacterium]|nr:hypothetical protein [Spirochaetota bacterium]
MRYSIIGLLVGILLGFSPVFMTHTGFLLTPLWYGSLQKIQAIEAAPGNDEKMSFAVTTDSGYYYIGASGLVHKFITAGDAFIKSTSDGKFYITYKKVGNEIALYNAANEFFWKLPSTEYPYISPDGSIIILLTADGSSARIADFNGNVYNHDELNGQFTTTVAFSQKGSFAGIGFIDGRYYICNNTGQIIYKGTSPSSTVVKGIAIDDTGKYALVHCGNSSKDYVVGINITRQKSFAYELSAPHHVKTSMAINTYGKALFLDFDRLLEIDIKGKDVTPYDIIKKRYGQSQVSGNDDIFMISYPADAGGSVWYVWQWGKGALYKREFYEEPFLHHILSHNIILLRGQDTLMCFSYQQ